MINLSEAGRILTGVFLVASAVVYLPGTAQAIPVNQQSCSVDGGFGANLITTTAGGGNPAWGDFSLVTGTSVTIDNGLVSRRVIVQFSADAGVDTNAEIRLGYSIDGSGPQFFGPQNLANYTEFWQTRSSLSVIRLGPGVHTIEPVWRVSGDPGKQAFMDDRCLTVEGRTR